jgi:GAF domain-containing protein
MEAVSRDELIQLFGDLSIELQAQKGIHDTLHSIVEAATHVVPGARWAGISLVEGNNVGSQTPTSPVVAELDQLQSHLNDGPCLTALREHHTVHIDDMSTETRWPRYAREAQQRGILSTLSFQLFVRDANLGALNLYADAPDAFSEESIVLGEVLAQHAAVAMVGVAAESQFALALATRDIIGQAKGILMHWMNLTGVQAFSLLTRASQRSNTKLVDVARQLVDRHESKLETADP